MLRRFTSCVDMSAIETEPALLGTFGTEKHSLAHKLCVILKTAVVTVLYFRYHAEFLLYLGISLLCSDLGEPRIYLGIYTVLVHCPRVE